MSRITYVPRDCGRPLDNSQANCRARANLITVSRVFLKSSSSTQHSETMDYLAH
jgi:hypothetical protein